MNDQERSSTETIATTGSELLGAFNDALQVAHSILRLMEGKMAQRDMLGAQALATMLHHQLIGLGAHGVNLASKMSHQHAN